MDSSSNRCIIADVETTGLSITSGDRIIEIGCIELIDGKRTSNSFHYYLNPECPVGEGAFLVHGLSYEFLDRQPVFADISESLREYLGGAEVVFHNSSFDTKFINNEFKLLDPGAVDMHSWCHVIDSLAIARERYPSKKNTLDALVKRFNLSVHDRQLHGALLDAQILSEVYLKLTETDNQGQIFRGSVDTGVGGLLTRTGGIALSAVKDGAADGYGETNTPAFDTKRPRLPVVRATDEEVEAHERYMCEINQDNSPSL